MDGISTKNMTVMSYYKINNTTIKVKITIYDQHKCHLTKVLYEREFFVFLLTVSFVYTDELAGLLGIPSNTTHNNN